MCEEATLDLKDLSALLTVNTDKMNFQQNMCFQMQNWAVLITIGTISFTWTTCESDNFLFVISHIALLLMLFLFVRERFKWMMYFVVFQERARVIENKILNNGQNKQSDKSSFYGEYFKFHGKDIGQLKKVNIIKFARGYSEIKEKNQKVINVWIALDAFFHFFKYFKNRKIALAWNSIYVYLVLISSLSLLCHYYE